jgi:propionate CoA-transferase
MSVLDEATALLSLARWTLSLARHDTEAPGPLPGHPKFMSAREAVDRIPDGAVVGVSGLGAHQRASLLHWALRERFLETGHPRGLTLVNVGGHGGRGLLPGTLEELALPGLTRRLVTSHFETFRAFLDLAAAGRCELQCLPLGVIAQLYAALARGEGSVVTGVGLGTFLDPRTGRGTPLQRGRREQLVAAAGARLRYRLPPIDVAVFNLPAADRRGNLYAKDAAMVGDSRELALAARRRGGLVIANVGLLVDEGYDRVFLPGRAVDAIVCHPATEQTVGWFHRAPWKAIVPGGRASIDAGLAHARLVRRLGELSGGFPRRTPVDAAVVRLAADVLLAETKRGARVAIGTGLPEEVAAAVHEAGAGARVSFLVESGVVGGVPAPGAYFGAAFAPRELVSTARLFALCRQRLDAACLGALEVDGAGNVNVSRRGRGAQWAIGPGGFMDFAEAARTIVFVTGWMRGGRIALESGRVRVLRRGAPKLVRRVAEVTFDGARALAARKKVLFVTPVGVFRLARRGLVLERVMPGIDVERDVRGVTPVPVLLPGSGEPAVVERAIVTGERRRRRAAARAHTNESTRSASPGVV